MAHAGLALGTAVGAWVNALVLAVLLWRRGMFVPDERLVRMIALSVAATFALLAVLEGLAPSAGRLAELLPAFPGLLPAAARLAAGGAAYLLVMFVGFRILRKRAPQG